MPSYDEPGGAQLVGIEHVAPVDDDGLRIGCAPRPSRARASSGHSVTTHGGVGAVERVERRLARSRRRARCAAPVRDRVPGADLGALGEQPAGEHEARRLAHVVGARLEREPEERDLLPAQRAEAPLELADHAPLLQLVHLDHGVQELEVVARVRRELLQRERVLREAGAAEADPGAQEGGPIRRSRPMPSATVTTSAPVASQTFAISLMKEIRVTSAAFAASLIISADATSQRTTGASMPSWSAATTSPSASSNAPMTIRSGCRKSRDRRALGGELRVRDVARRSRGRARRAGGAPRARCRPAPCSSSRRRSGGRPAAARRRPSRRRRGRRRRSRSAACRRRCRRRPLRRPPRRRRS